MDNKKQETEKATSEEFDVTRRSAMKKILLGGALVGSVAIFGSSLVPNLTNRAVSNGAVSSGYYADNLVSMSSPVASLTTVTVGSAYPSASNSLPKPANRPSLLYTGSIHDGASSLQLAVIAGILARDTPKIYLADAAFSDNNLEGAMSNHYGVSFNNSQSTNALISMFGSEACGSPARWIRYEASYDMGSQLGQNEAVDQLNAVRTLCGVFNALPVPAGQSPPISAEGSPLYDISSWGSSVPLYQKIWGMVSGSVGKQWLAINPPSGSSLRLDMTDYIVMSKAFSFQVPLVKLNSSYPSVQDQKNFAASVINAYPTPYAVLGYSGIGLPDGGKYEVDFVSALSGGSGANNSSLAGSSPSAHGAGYYTGAQNVGNMSVKTAFAPFSGATFPNPAAAPAYSSGQKYISIIASQGDCLDWTENNLASYMLACQSAGMPIGITMTQTSQWLSPPIVHWYIDNINSNSGIVTSGSAGAGYNHVTELPNMSQFLATGAQTGANANVKDFFFIDGPGVNPLANGASVANEYINGLKNGGVSPRSLWWWSPTGVAPSIINGVPCFFTAINISETNLSSQGQCNTAIGKAIDSAHSNFIAMFLNTTWPNPSFLKSACASHGAKPLPPGTFANLYRSAHGLSPI